MTHNATHGVRSYRHGGGLASLQPVDDLYTFVCNHKASCSTWAALDCTGIEVCMNLRSEASLVIDMLLHVRLQPHIYTEP